MTSVDALPDAPGSLKRLLLAREEEVVVARAAQAAAEAEGACALAQVSSPEAMTAHYKLAIEKFRRVLYGESSERGERLLGQMEPAHPADGQQTRCFMRAERARLSRHAAIAKAFNYMLTRSPAFTLFLPVGRICLTNNAADRAFRGIALGRKTGLFAGSDRGGERAAVVYSLIATARLNDGDPQTWLVDILARIADHPIRRLDEPLPWNWRKPSGAPAAA